MAVDASAGTLLLRGAAETLSLTVEDDGVIVDPGDTTVGVVDAAGATVLAAGTATSGTGADARTVALDASQTATLNRWTVTWTTADYGTFTQDYEIVGAHLFTIAEARAFDVGVLGDSTTYSDANIDEKRTRILDEFENICGVAFVPRYDYVTLDGPMGALGDRTFLYKSNGDRALRVSAIRSIEYRIPGATTWTAFTADELAAAQRPVSGSIYRESIGIYPYGVSTVRVGFEHGWPRPPLAIKDAALTLIRYLLVPKNLSSRALQENSQYGPIQLAVAGRYGDHYGIPAVDSVLDRYIERVPAIA